MLVYIDNIRLKNVKIINDYNKVSEYKVNIKSQFLSYIPPMNNCNLKFKMLHNSFYISMPV